jgi:hypothetical protein
MLHHPLGTGGDVTQAWVVMCVQGTSKAERDDYAKVQGTIMAWWVSTAVHHPFHPPLQPLTLTHYTPPRLLHRGYKVLLSLADQKRSGVAVLLREGLHHHVRSVAFNLTLDGEEGGGHHPEGRIILLEFDRWGVLCTYCPNHGYDDASFKRWGAGTGVLPCR